METTKKQATHFSIDELRTGMLEALYETEPSRNLKETVRVSIGLIMGARRAGMSWELLVEAMARSGVHTTVGTLKKYCTELRSELKNKSVQKQINEIVKAKRHIDLIRESVLNHSATMDMTKPSIASKQTGKESENHASLPSKQRLINGNGLGVSLAALRAKAEVYVQLKEEPPRTQLSLKVVGNRVYLAEGVPFKGRLSLSDVVELETKGTLQRCQFRTTG